MTRRTPRKVPWKPAAKIVVVCVAFAVALTATIIGFKGLPDSDALPAAATLGVPLVVAWLIAAALGRNLLPARHALALATICLLVAAPIAFYGPWRAPGVDGGGVQPGDNAQAGEVLFKYEASFTYLESDDNGPVEANIFLLFPCPIINNKPVFENLEVDHQVRIKNMRWQLWGPVEGENGARWMELEVDNGRLIQAVGERPSFSPVELCVYWTWVGATSYGPKVWLQFSLQLDNCIYRGERAYVEGTFTVPNSDVNKVTLVDNQGGVHAQYDGRNWVWIDGEGSGIKIKRVNGEFWTRLSKQVGENFETVVTFNLLKENTCDEWVELRPI